MLNEVLSNYGHIETPTSSAEATAKTTMSVLSYNYISLCVSAFLKCNVIQLTAYSCKTFKLLTMIISSDVSWKLTRTWSYIKNITAYPNLIQNFCLFHSLCWNFIKLGLFQRSCRNFFHYWMLYFRVIFLYWVKSSFETSFLEQLDPGILCL